MSGLTIEAFEHEGARYLLVAYPIPSLGCFADLAGAELEVVCRFVEGKSMKEIASARQCSVRTVANQLASAYQKLGVSSRTELLALVHRSSPRR